MKIMTPEMFYVNLKTQDAEPMLQNLGNMRNSCYRKESENYLNVRQQYVWSCSGFFFCSFRL